MMMGGKTWLWCLGMGALLLAGCGSSPEGTGGSVEEQLSHIRHSLHELKEKLEEEDKYVCCIEEPHCDWCALKEGSCGCGPALGFGEPVCPDCVLGWREGKGSVEGVDPSEVRSTLDPTPH